MIHTEIITDLAFAIVQIFDSRNREADCFPGTVKYPHSAPLRHPKPAAIRATKRVLTCSDRSQYSALHILGICLQGRQGNGQESGEPRMAHEQAVYFMCQGYTETSGSRARLAQGRLGNQSLRLRKAARQQELLKPTPLGHPGTRPHTQLCFFP